jgi:hypothetical protein
MYALAPTLSCLTVLGKIKCASTRKEKDNFMKVPQPVGTRRDLDEFVSSHSASIKQDSLRRKEQKSGIMQSIFSQTLLTVTISCNKCKSTPPSKSSQAQEKDNIPQFYLYTWFLHHTFSIFVPRHRRPSFMIQSYQRIHLVKYHMLDPHTSREHAGTDIQQYLPFHR